VVLCSDSKYVIDGLEKGWAKKWRSLDWYKNSDRKDKAQNADLWDRLLIVAEKHRIDFEWVKGHTGHLENERCDALTHEGRKEKELQIDVEYEKVNPYPLYLQSAPDKENIEKGKGVSVTDEGHSCKKCGTSVVKKVGKSQRYKWYLMCPMCKTVYFTKDGEA
jgi:ribonuclease HI